EPDVAQISERGETMVRDLIDVEGELGLHVLMLAFGIIHGVAITSCEFGKLKSDCPVGCLRVAVGVTDVMRHSPDGKGELVGVMGVAQEGEDKVAGADIVREVREK